MYGEESSAAGRACAWAGALRSQAPACDCTWRAPRAAAPGLVLSGSVAPQGERSTRARTSCRARMVQRATLCFNAFVLVGMEPPARSASSGSDGFGLLCQRGLRLVLHGLLDLGRPGGLSGRVPSGASSDLHETQAGSRAECGMRGGGSGSGFRPPHNEREEGGEERGAEQTRSHAQIDLARLFSLLRAAQPRRADDAADHRAATACDNRGETTRGRARTVFVTLSLSHLRWRRHSFSSSCSSSARRRRARARR